jgi:hypothetical protein
MTEIHSMSAPAGNQNVISATCMYRHIAELDDCNIGIPNGLRGHG